MTDTEGTFHADNGCDYPARLLHDSSCGTTTIEVTFPPDSILALPLGGTETIHLPTTLLDKFFTVSGAARTDRSISYSDVRRAEGE